MSVSKDWAVKFKENYEGKSEQAKELETLLKQNYGGAVYVPWAAMERFIYEQDPEANWEVVRDTEGGLVTTDQYILETLQDVGEKVSNTKADFFVHMIVMEVTFLGKKVVEYYPIQKTTKGDMYGAPKVIDANMVNNAIKRGVTKAFSRVSGLALKLYEGLDLQFEEEIEAPKKPEPKKTETKKTKTKAEPKAEPKKTKKETKPAEETKTLDGEIDAHVLELAEYVAGNEELKKGIQATNAAVKKKYKFTFSLKDSVEEVAEKLMKVSDAGKFVRTLQAQSGVKVE